MISMRIYKISSDTKTQSDLDLETGKVIFELMKARERALDANTLFILFSCGRYKTTQI